MPRSRGRPRKDPERLARWTPPSGWVRVVAWVSPEERRALKRVAVEADASVAQLIRSLASGLAGGVIEADELLRQVRKGVEFMDITWIAGEETWALLGRMVVITFFYGGVAWVTLRFAIFIPFRTIGPKLPSPPLLEKAAASLRRSAKWTSQR